MWHIIGPKSAQDRPNDVISGIVPGKFAFFCDDLQDIALGTGREEKQLEAKPVEQGSDETIGDDSDNLCVQERRFFGPKPLCPFCAVGYLQISSPPTH